MKQGNNNEIDLLLRSLARGRRGESALKPDGGLIRETEGPSDHLDADELSSFAEGVVPAPARARFIAHLADCENCRGVVVGLTQASGATARPETLEPQTGAGFWQKIAALFSPPVLRYAVPALALAGVISVSFFVLRQRQPDIARNEGTESAAPAGVAEQPAGAPLTQSNIETPGKSRDTTLQPRERVEGEKERKSLLDDKQGDTGSLLAKSDADTSSVPSLKSVAQAKQPEVAGVDRRVFAPAPASAEPPPPKPTPNEADKVGEKEQVEISKREVQSLPVEEPRNQPRDEAGRHGPSRNNNAIGGARRADGLVLDGIESRTKSKKDSDDEGETRTVSGRRFRRQGNAWVDTAYDSSRRTVNISRGSEQFRALVADEPAIRSIAEKLSGVIIVVANGRAYRIQ